MLHKWAPHANTLNAAPRNRPPPAAVPPSPAPPPSQLAAPLNRPRLQTLEPPPHGPPRPSARPRRRPPPSTPRRLLRRGWRRICRSMQPLRRSSRRRACGAGRLPDGR
eukprot:366138-Chlamydomonas_euryale.AAC.3